MKVNDDIIKPDDGHAQNYFKPKFFNNTKGRIKFRVPITSTWNVFKNSTNIFL